MIINEIKVRGKPNLQGKRLLAVGSWQLAVGKSRKTEVCLPKTQNECRKPEARSQWQKDFFSPSILQSFRRNGRDGPPGSVKTISEVPALLARGTPLKCVNEKNSVVLCEFFVISPEDSGLVVVKNEKYITAKFAKKTQESQRVEYLNKGKPAALHSPGLTAGGETYVEEDGRRLPAGRQGSPKTGVGRWNFVPLGEGGGDTGAGGLREVGRPKTEVILSVFEGCLEDERNSK